MKFKPSGPINEINTTLFRLWNSTRKQYKESGISIGNGRFYVNMPISMIDIMI